MTNILWNKLWLCGGLLKTTWQWTCWLPRQLEWGNTLDDVSNWILKSIQLQKQFVAFCHLKVRGRDRERLRRCWSDFFELISITATVVSEKSCRWQTAVWAVVSRYEVQADRHTEIQWYNTYAEGQVVVQLLADGPLGSQVLVVRGGLRLLHVLLLPLLHGGLIGLLVVWDGLHDVLSTSSHWLEFTLDLAETLNFELIHFRWKFPNLLSSMGVVASPSSLGLLYMLAVFFLPLEWEL